MPAWHVRDTGVRPEVVDVTQWPVDSALEVEVLGEVAGAQEVVLLGGGARLEVVAVDVVDVRGSHLHYSSFGLTVLC